MRALPIIAAIEAALVLLWVLEFRDTIGTPHQHWYVEVPIFFLVTPMVTAVAWRRVARIEGDVGCLAAYGLGLLLAANLLGFVGYAMLSGGGI